MKPVIQALINLLNELSSGQDGVKITGYLHDLLIAIMHVEHWRLIRLIALLAVVATMWDNEPASSAKEQSGGGGEHQQKPG